MRPIYNLLNVLQEYLKALSNFLLLILAGMLLVACAQVVSPTGGPKDTTPPKIVSSEPQNFSINYTGNRIELEFDEFVQLRSFNQEFVSSPPLPNPAKAKLNGKHLTIQLEDSLLPGITYQFNFGKSIVDLHESNPLDSNIFVVSTGSFIDSLTLRGTVKNAFTLAPEKDILVFLYKDLADSMPMLQKPLYNTKTNDKGEYKFAYLAAGAYRLVALKDISGNGLFEPEVEEFAFETNWVQPAIADSSDTITYDLALFTPKKNKQYIKNFNAEPPGKISFLTNIPVKTLQAKCAALSGKKDWFLQDFKFPTDSFVFWTQGLEGIDTIQFEIKSDEIDTVIAIATSSFSTEKKQGMGAKAGKGKTIEVATAKVDDKVKWNEMLKVTFEKPVQQFMAEKHILVEGNDTIALKQEWWAMSKNLRDFSLNIPWKADSVYTLILPDSTVFDLYGTPNDSIVSRFKVLSEKNYGNVTISIQHEKAVAQQFVVELLDSQKKVIKTFSGLKNGDKITLEMLLVGTYGLRLIEDTNGNSTWDTGEYLKALQPEKVWLFKNPIEVKAGFDEDIIWQIQ